MASKTLETRFLLQIKFKVKIFFLQTLSNYISLESSFRIESTASDRLRKQCPDQRQIAVKVELGVSNRDSNRRN